MKMYLLLLDIQHDVSVGIDYITCVYIYIYVCV